MSRTRHIAIALELEKPYAHHQNIYAGTQHYATMHADWRCTLDEHPGLSMSNLATGERPYDGVIARATPELAEQLDRLGIPLVNVWYQNIQPGLPSVFVDPELLGRQAAEHLIDRGFRRLSYLVNPGRSYAVEMGKGFEARAVESSAQCLLHRYLAGDYTDPEYWMAFKKDLGAWLDQLIAPFGLFMEVPQDARIIIDLCRARGRRVPQDVAILCYADTKQVAENPPPQISTFDLNFERVGYEAAALLDQLMDGEPAPSRPLLLPPKGVIARESTDYFAVEDDLVAEALVFISSELGGQLTLERIASKLTVSPRLLQLRFDAALGRSVSDEIRRLRLAVAKRMLSEEDRQLSEIARQTGFGQQSNLTRVFRRELGVTPSDYRKQILGDKD